MTRAFAIFLLCASASSVFAQGAPATVSFVARFEDSGLPLMGNHDMIFSLWDASSGGTQLWTETRSQVAVGMDGLVYLDLGSVTPLTSAIFGGQARYLEITLDQNPPATPRILIESVPYALRSSKASDADLFMGHSLSFFQQSVVNGCTGTQSIQTINPDGSVSCYTGQVYTAGTGGGLALAANAFSVDTTVQRTVGACGTAGQAITAIAQNGTVTCAPIASYTAGTGISITTNQIAVNFSAFGSCAAGSTLNHFDSAGNAVCSNTTYTAGTGLALAANSFSVDTGVIQARIVPQTALVSGNLSINNNAYTSAAPSVSPTIPSSGTALVTVTAAINPGTNGALACMSFAGGGFTGTDQFATCSDIGGQTVQMSATYLVSNFSAGSQTISATYRTTGGHSVTFSNRSIIVVPLP